MAFTSIHECDDDIKNVLNNNIVVSGGNTGFKGFPERLEKELNAMCP